MSTKGEYIMACGRCSAKVGVAEALMYVGVVLTADRQGIRVDCIRCNQAIAKLQLTRPVTDKEMETGDFPAGWIAQDELSPN